MQELPKIGRLIPAGTNPGRDAVHVAIAPVMAGQTLRRGQYVGFSRNGSVVAGDGSDDDKTQFVTCIGIVDPFLDDDVKKGQLFYVWLRPGTITSLRHVWSHPAFAPKSVVDKVCSGCLGSGHDDWGRGSGFGMCPKCNGTGTAVAESQS